MYCTRIRSCTEYISQCMYVCVCVCIRICVLQVYYPLNIYAIPKQEIIFRARGTSISGNHILGKKIKHVNDCRCFCAFCALCAFVISHAQVRVCSVYTVVNNAAPGVYGCFREMVLEAVDITRGPALCDTHLERSHR